MLLQTKDLNNKTKNDELKNGCYVVRGPIWDKKNIESEKTKKNNNSTSSTQQIKVPDSNANVLTSDKINELKGHIDCDYLDKARIAEVKPKKNYQNFIFS